MKTATLALIALVISVSCADAGPAAARTFVYVSNYVDGDIAVYDLNTETGALSSRRTVRAGSVVMPLSVAIDGRHLYAAVRSAPTRVLTYDIDSTTGDLMERANAPLPASMSNIASDRSGRFLFTTSYSDDLVAVSPIDADGRVTRAPIQVVRTGENAHSLQADRSNRFAFATNLGSDQIMQFHFDAATGALSPNQPPVLKTPVGDGPRHFVVSRDNKYLYVIYEMAGTVTQLAIDPQTGTLSLVYSIGTVPTSLGLQHGIRQAPMTEEALGARPQVATPTEKPTIWAADIDMTPDGRFLYTSERTNSLIGQLDVDPTNGRPTYRDTTVTVRQPRGIKIDPKGRFLVVAGEQSEEVAVYRIDAANGHLTEVGRYPGGRGGSWVEIIEVPARRG